MDSTFPLPANAAVPRSGGWRSRVGAYVGLTKPRIIELLLVTTVPAMVLADRGVPSPWLVLTVLFGGTLAAGGANTINCVCDRDIDEKMQRTHGRPLPLGLVAVPGAGEDLLAAGREPDGQPAPGRPGRPEDPDLHDRQVT